MSFELTATIQRETDNAILLDSEDLDEAIWIPLSQVEEIHRQKNGVALVVMSDWIAQVKGLS